jgi:hypothetical protein
MLVYVCASVISHLYKKKSESFDDHKERLVNLMNSTTQCDNFFLFLSPRPPLSSLPPHSLSSPHFSLYPLAQPVRLPAPLVVPPGPTSQVRPLPHPWCPLSHLCCPCPTQSMPSPWRACHVPDPWERMPHRELHPHRHVGPAWPLDSWARPTGGGDSGPTNGSRWISAANPGPSDLGQPGLPMGHHYINPPSQMGSSFVQCISRRSLAKFLPERRQGGTVLGGMTSASWFLKFHCYFAAVCVILLLRWGALPILHNSVVVILL